MQAVFLSAGGSLWENIVTWYQNSLLGEIIYYLTQKYFTVKFGAYEHFSLGRDASQMAQTVIIGIAIGIIVSAGIAAYTKNRLGGFVNKLIKNDCISPDCAKTLFEIGEFRNGSVRRALVRGYALRGVVRCCGEDAYLQSVNSSAEDATNSGENTHTCDENAPTCDENAHTCDQNEQTQNKEKPAEKKELAEAPPRRWRKKTDYKLDFMKDRFYVPEEMKYRASVRFERKGSGWILFALSFVVAPVFAALACWALPELLQMADNLITMIAP